MNRRTQADCEAALDRLLRGEPGRLLSVLIRALGDFDLAEDALQDAVALALDRWPKSGVPANPGGWLVTAARRRAIDVLRRSAAWRRREDAVRLLGELEAEAAAEPPEAPHPIADERLRLIFTCCHPALAPEARVALTLRTLGGLATPEIARAFLLPEATMAQRLVRAKRKIREAGIPYRVPDPQALGERLSGVLAVLMLVFNEGYAASSGEALTRAGLTAEAIRLARLLVVQLPGEPEPRGLLALMLFHEARRATRSAGDGSLVLLDEQERGLWDRPMIAEANAVLGAAIALGRPGPYQIQAAIAGMHANAPSAEVTAWDRIAALYDRLAEIAGTPVVALNRAVAYAMADGPAAGLSLLEAIPDLQDYHLYHAARADLLRRMGRRQEAAQAYRLALLRTANRVERGFLEQRLKSLER